MAALTHDKAAVNWKIMENAVGFLRKDGTYLRTFFARERNRVFLKLWLVGQHQTRVEEVNGSAGCSQF